MKIKEEQYIDFIDNLLDVLEDVHCYVDEMEFSEEEKEIIKLSKYSYVLED